MRFSLLSVRLCFLMSKRMIDCTEKENTLMHLMVKAMGVDSNLAIEKAFECANILMHGS